MIVVGNPQALGAKPLTFPRQVISLVAAPFLLEHPKILEIYPPDAIERAKHMLDLLKTGVGAYTDSRGCIGIREEVAKFIEDRDGFPANPEVTSHTFITPQSPLSWRSCRISF